jgi:DNA-binding FadR family transcriptional regulator
MLTPRIRRRKLHHEVADRLLSEIRAGNHPPGSLLPSERALMEMFGIGRPAIREALQGLERMRVISIRHGEGARVQTLSAESVISQIAEIAHFLISSAPQMLEHLKRARLAFEVALARDAAMLATDADIERLRCALEAQAAANAADFSRVDTAFHLVMATISRNPIYLGLSEAMFDLLQRFFLNRNPTIAARRKTLDEHREIFERIAARDAEGAARAMNAHLQRVQDLYSHRAERRNPL